MKKNSNKIKAEQLGMPYGTACAKLRKQIMFDMARKLNMLICNRCNKSIETIEEFSIDHKIPWLYNDKKLFWDLDNIEFAHLKCNIRLARKLQKQPIKHGHSNSYKNGCRCKECNTAHSIAQKEYIKKK